VLCYERKTPSLGDSPLQTPRRHLSPSLSSLPSLVAGVEVGHLCALPCVLTMSLHCGGRCRLWFGAAVVTGGLANKSSRLRALRWRHFLLLAATTCRATRSLASVSMDGFTYVVRVLSVWLVDCRGGLLRVLSPQFFMPTHRLLSRAYGWSLISLF
jgi:hypothetical protein